MSKIIAVVLDYAEPGWTSETMRCLHETGISSTVIVSRGGTGSMSKAFNEAKKAVMEPEGAQYVWFITNVTFSPEVPISLVSCFEDDVAAVHPAMRNSDHAFLREPKEAQEIPFTEWTAPMVRISALRQIGWLDERMPYVHFDMEWSHRARKAGFRLMVDGRSEVAHKYLHSNHEHPISLARHRKRAEGLEASARAMADAMGFPYQGFAKAEQTARNLLVL